MFSWPLTRQRNAWISDWIVSSTRKRIYCKSEKKRYVYTESVSCNCCFTRLYLINSPVVRAETLKFKEKGVKDIIKDVFLPWYNAHRFLLQNIQQMERVSQHLYFSVFLKLRACDLNFFCRRAAQQYLCNTSVAQSGSPVYFLQLVTLVQWTAVTQQGGRIWGEM